MFQVVLESIRSIEKCSRLKLAPKDPKDFEILVSCFWCGCNGEVLFNQLMEIVCKMQFKFFQIFTRAPNVIRDTNTVVRLL